MFCFFVPLAVAVDLSKMVPLKIFIIINVIPFLKITGVSQSDSVQSKIAQILLFYVQGFVHSSTLIPSQVLGFEVDSINSVQFSNHTGGSSVFQTPFANQPSDFRSD